MLARKRDALQGETGAQDVCYLCLGNLMSLSASGKLVLRDLNKVIEGRSQPVSLYDERLGALPRNRAAVKRRYQLALFTVDKLIDVSAGLAPGHLVLVVDKEVTPFEKYVQQFDLLWELHNRLLDARRGRPARGRGDD